MLAQKLRQAGSEVKYQNFDGATHEFFGMAAAVRDAERAQDLAAHELRDAFAHATPRATGSHGQAEQPKRRSRDKLNCPAGDAPAGPPVIRSSTHFGS